MATPDYVAWSPPGGGFHSYILRQTFDRPTLENILAYSHNPAVRRALIDRYGRGRFKGATGFVRDTVRQFFPGLRPYKVNQEDGVGTLWRLTLVGEHPIHVVEVIDSAAMRNGRHKHHWLRVPHSIMTARAAVAWTFGLRADQYHPVKET